MITMIIIVIMIEIIATKYSRRHGFQPRCLLQQEYVRPLTTTKYVVALIIMVTTLIIMTTLIIVATLIIVVTTLIIMTTLIIVTTIMMMVMMMWQ